jgi:hypothetical protein
VSAVEAVLVLTAGLIFLGLLFWFSCASREMTWRRTAVRREQLRTEVELQRLTHLAVLQMLAAARKDYGHRS